MSFAFRVVRQTWDENYENREITEININRGDVSIVNQGANPATSFSMRDARTFLEAMSRDEFVTLMRSIAPDVLPEPSEDRQDERKPTGGYPLNLAIARALALRTRL